MTREEAFLRDIWENPEDDTPRLVYADWLEENGRPERGEFIRLQCELDPLPYRDSRRRELTARAGKLWAEHGIAWRAELPAINGGFWGSSFRRGFIEEATFHTWTAFAEQA